MADIDIDALLVRGRRPRSKHDHSKKAQAAIARNKAKRQAELTKAWHERVDGERAARAAVRRGRLTVCARLLCAMEPGVWYGLPELADALGVHLWAIKPWFYGTSDSQSRFGPGLFEKGRNGAFDARVSVLEHFRGGKFPSRFLWRLSDRGEAARELALLEG